MNAEAALNKERMLDTLAVFQHARFWLKDVAERKVPYMSKALATFQPPMGWLKAVAELRV